MPAIALKTRSPVLSTTAFLPLVGPAYLAYVLWSEHKPENTIDQLERDALKASGKYDSLLTFKHGLLKYDWAPSLHIGGPDSDMFQKGRQIFAGLDDLNLTVPQKRQLRAERRKRKRDLRARKGEKRKERLAAEEGRRGRRR
jgi:hypothetical protein